MKTMDRQFIWTAPLCQCWWEDFELKNRIINFYKMIGVLTSYCHTKIIWFRLYEVINKSFYAAFAKYLFFFYCFIERNIIVHIYSSVMPDLESSFLSQYQVQLYRLIRQDKKRTSGQTRACEKPEGCLYRGRICLFFSFITFRETKKNIVLWGLWLYYCFV